MFQLKSNAFFFPLWFLPSSSFRLCFWYPAALSVTLLHCNVEDLRDQSSAHWKAVSGDQNTFDSVDSTSELERKEQ